MWTTQVHLYADFFPTNTISPLYLRVPHLQSNVDQKYSIPWMWNLCMRANFSHMWVPHSLLVELEYVWILVYLVGRSWNQPPAYTEGWIIFLLLKFDRAFYLILCSMNEDSFIFSIVYLFCFFNIMSGFWILSCFFCIYRDHHTIFLLFCGKMH